jgi:predicted small secreted protein
MFKIICLTFLLLISTTFISGCSTMSGLGQDVESVGDAIEDSAEENKSY